MYKNYIEMREGIDQQDRSTRTSLIMYKNYIEMREGIDQQDQNKFNNI